MAPGTPNTRLFFRYPVFGETTMDVLEVYATLGASTQGSGVATIAGRMIPVTRASDGILTAHMVAVDNIAGMMDLTLVHDQP